MQFDFKTMKPMDRYELLLGTVIPRPITIVTTLSAGGALNAAPYSLFNVVGHDPPVIMLAVLPHPEGRLKDTAENIFATREFVVNLVPQSLAEAMNITCIDAPPEIDELTLAGLTPAASQAVRPPRIAESPVSFECRVLTSLVTGPRQTAVIGRIVRAHVDDAVILDKERCHIDTQALRLIARMHGSGWYARSTDLFQIDRPSWAAWQENNVKA
jgi:flavin reductase (DIM6/NTAB) family NADH-FMN oxidoreductase RutF